ncbi:uncharacterized protein [Paramisgurnus dabryanus]|uniref:uncharacterized protein n=1 Tax=Paramisgurnus dabryanus TaxID=90735 RepID=UPI0031F4222C
MKTISLLFFISIFINSVFGDEVKSVSVKEGDSLTLHTDFTDTQADDVTIVWTFGPQKSTIAKINREPKGNKISIFDDVLDGRFRDRLQLKDQSGDLTITDITTQHTGVYEVEITVRSKIIQKSFNVNGVINPESNKLKSVSVKDGDSVTLHTDDPDIKKYDEIQWRFKGIPIAQFNKSASEISEDERFRDKLQLDVQTGYLKIKNIRMDLSGLYEVDLTTTSSVYTIHQPFTVTVSGEVKSVSVMKGDPVTIYTDVPDIKTYDQILLIFGCDEKRIAEVNKQNKKFTLYGEVRDGLKLNDQTGDLTITNFRTEDAGLYELKMSSRRRSIQRRFSVSVSEQGLSPVAIAVISVIFLLLAAVAAAAGAGVIYYRRKVAEPKHQLDEIQPLQAYAGESKLLLVDEGESKPLQAYGGESKPSQVYEGEQKPLQADEGEPKPSQADEGEPKPSQADAGEPKPLQADAGEPKPWQAYGREPKPWQAYGGEPKLLQPWVGSPPQPSQADADAGKPKPWQVGGGEPKPWQAYGREPKPSQAYGGEPKLLQPWVGSPPQPSQVDAGKPKPWQADAGKPKPSQVDAEEPKPLQADAGEPKPSQADAGEPKPSQADAGEPKPSQVDAGKPKPWQVGGGEPKPWQAYGRDPKPSQAYEGEPKPSQTYGGVPKLLQPWFGSPPKQSQAYGGKPKPSQAYGGVPKPWQAYGGEPKPSQADAGEPKPSQVDAEEPKPLQADAGEPKPSQADAGEPKPSQADAGEPKPSQVDAGKPKPWQVGGGEPKPSQADAGEPKPSQVDAGKPKPWQVGGGEPKPWQAYGRDPKPSQAYGGEPKPSQTYGGVPKLLQPWFGSPPKQSQAYGGKPKPSQAYGGVPKPWQAYGGEPKLSQADAGEPKPSQVDAGEPKPSQADAGEPKPSQADAGEPKPSQADAGKPKPSQVDAGEPKPLQADAGEPKPSQADAGEPKPSQAYAGESANLKTDTDIQRDGEMRFNETLIAEINPANNISSTHDAKMEKVSVNEGESYTLKNNLTEIKRDDVIEWTFKETLIAEINPTNKIFRTYDGDDDLFRDKLKLNLQTGDLNIKDISEEHTGDYTLKIIRDGETSYKRFIVFVRDEIKTLQLYEGESADLKAEVKDIKKVDLIEWRFGETLIAELSPGMFFGKSYKDKSLFRDKLKLNPQTGDLNINDISEEHDGVYKLKIIRDGKTSHKRFRVSVRASKKGIQ